MDHPSEPGSQVATVLHESTRFGIRSGQGGGYGCQRSELSLLWTENIAASVNTASIDSHEGTASTIHRVLSRASRIVTLMFMHECITPTVSPRESRIGTGMGNADVIASNGIPSRSMGQKGTSEGARVSGRIREEGI
jgi:hypothetical protein